MFHNQSGNRNYTLIDILLALAILIFLFVSWEPGKTGAQSPDPTPVECWTEPDGTPVCIGHIEMPTPFVPTASPLPAPTVAPTPTPVATIAIVPLHRGRVYLVPVFGGAA